MKEHAEIFSDIYDKGSWGNKRKGVPLSGPGSSLPAAKDISNMLDKFISDIGIKTVTDLGCGDLTWISKSQFFNNDDINYTGVDVVESLIDSHKKNFDKNFELRDITNYVPERTDLIIIRDVIFHLKNEDILNIFKNIKGKFKYICITSNINEVNPDASFITGHFAERNIRQEPFNVSGKCLIQLRERSQNGNFRKHPRDELFFTSEEFYNEKN